MSPSRLEDTRLDNWESFEKELQKIARSRNRTRRAGHYVTDILFRGHADSTWPLDTSLDRSARCPYTPRQYYALISDARHRIAAFTRTSWDDILGIEDFVQGLRDEVLLRGPRLAPALKYMVYLRHHGFPSPLLDWTMSPYIAAYFAFRERPRADRVAIYVYIEQEEIKAFDPARPMIKSLGHNIPSDPRHVLQQCQYTMCYKIRDGQPSFCDHEDAIAYEFNEVNRTDRTWKFTLPVDERNKILARLEAYNINAYSLFGSEDSLMEATFTREDLRRLDNQVGAEQARKNRKRLTREARLRGWLPPQPPRQPHDESNNPEADENHT